MHFLKVESSPQFKNLYFWENSQLIEKFKYAQQQQNTHYSQVQTEHPQE